MKQYKKLTFAGALLVGSLAANANIILKTGVDANGNVLSAGAIDPFWDISLDAGKTYTDAKVIYPAQVWQEMGSIPAGAAWVVDQSITASSDGTGWGINNPVWLTRSFDLTGYDMTSLSLNGDFRIADQTIGVYINDTLVTGTDNLGSDTWSQNQSISGGSSYFKSGVNTITLRGQSINSRWDGFYLNATLQGTSSNTNPTEPNQVSEPATYAMFTVALLGMLRLRKRFI